MSKNITTFYTDGNPKYKGLEIPTDGLTEADVLDADYLADRELSFAFPSALTSAKSFKLQGKNIGIDIYKGSTITHTWYGDIPTEQTITLPVGTTKVIVKGSVTHLDVSSKGINTLDVTRMPCLEELYCSINQLTSLDVSKNVALTTLYCYDNQLISLDLSKNVALTELYCGRNQLTSLDVSKNIALTKLGCSGNQLTSLDLPKNAELIGMDCSDNQLASLALPQFKDDVEIVMGGNPLVADYTSATAWLNSLPKQNIPYDEKVRDIYIGDDDLADEIGEDYIKDKGYGVYGEY